MLWEVVFDKKETWVSQRWRRNELSWLGQQRFSIREVIFHWKIWYGWLNKHCILQNIHCFQASGCPSDPGFCIFNGIPTCPSWYLIDEKVKGYQLGWTVYFTRVLKGKGLEKRSYNKHIAKMFHDDSIRKTAWIMILQIGWIDISISP